MDRDGDLVVEDLRVSYGPSQALFGVSFAVATGQMLALLGANGAGKSTLGRAVSGLIPISAGKVHLGSEDITRWGPDRIRRAGLAYIPEGRGIFPGLSVRDNLRMATVQLASKAERNSAIERVVEHFPVLGQRGQQRAGSLSGGEQQMLAMARVLAVNPKVIIADEISLGLAPLVVDQVFQTLEGARGAGITIVLIEQYIYRALELADTAMILTRGRPGWSGPASHADKEILDHYLGDKESHAPFETQAADDGSRTAEARTETQTSQDRELPLSAAGKERDIT
jgi:branched-chain amino acid transport system ATP-binding protein